MKNIKLLFLLSATIFFMQAKGQVFFTETFDGGTLPAGWTIQNQPSNWSISNTSKAGGEPNEVILNRTPNFNGKTRLISPVIDLSGVTDVAIEFLHYLDHLNGACIIGVETTSNGGQTWKQAFQKVFFNVAHGEINEGIFTSDVGSENFQFCIYFNGNSTSLNAWYFDNFKLFGIHDNNVVVSALNNNTYNLAGNYPIDFSVINNGVNNVNSLEISYQINDEQAVTEQFEVNIKPYETKSLTFSQVPTFAPGSYNITVEILKINDEIFESENVFSKYIFVATQPAERKVCIEHFTSSTCVPCVGANEQMKSLLTNPANEGKFSITKYQMNFPGGGDLYYTLEGGVRKDYYRVNAVPLIYFNAKNTAINQTNFDNALQETAFIDVSGHFYVDGNNIYVNAAIKSYIEIPEAILYVIVNEKTTTKNAGSNGEKSFEHVMMKMLPDAHGTNINIKSGETKYFSFVQNMSSTKVEEMDDLEVHVFVQDYDSKFIFNSGFLVETDFGIDQNKTSNLTIYPNPANDFLKIVQKNSEKSRVEIYNSVGISVKTVEINEIETEINISELPAGTYSVKVVTGQNSVTERFIKY